MPVSQWYRGSLCDIVQNALKNRTLTTKLGLPKDELICGLNSLNQWATRTSSDKQEQIRSRAVTNCG